MALTVIRVNGGELALNIKLLTHTLSLRVGEVAVSDYRKRSSNRSQLGATLTGIVRQVFADTAV